MAGYPGKQGAKPKPTVIRLLEGNRGRRPLNANEPTAAPRLAAPPPELSEGAKREWRRTGRKLLAARIITDLDAAQFAAYCSSYARWLEMTALMAKLPAITKGPQGNWMVHPMLRVIAQAQEQYTRALVEFGMSPSSRSRIQVMPEAKDELDALLG